MHSTDYPPVVADLSAEPQLTSSDIEEDISKSVLQALKIVLSPEQQLTPEPTPDRQRQGVRRIPAGLSMLRNGTDAAALDEATGQFEAVPRASIQRLRRRTPVCARRMSSATPTCGDRNRSRRPRNPAREAVQLDSNLPDVHLAFGLLYSATGQFESAEVQYRKAIAQDADLTEAYLGLATALSERRLDAGRRGDLPAGHPRAAALLGELRRLRLVPRDRGAPRRCDHSVPASAPSSRRTMRPCTATSARPTSCSATSAMPRRRSAAPSRSRRPARATRTPATMYYFDGRYDDAAAMFEQAVKLAPQDHSLWGNLADAYRYSNAKNCARTGDLREGGRACPREPARQPGGHAGASAARLLPGAAGPLIRSRGRADARRSRGCHRAVRPLLRRAWRTSSSATRMPPFRS